MKKIVVIFAVLIFFAGCGKKESGILTVTNKSQYDVTFGVSQNYSDKNYHLQSGKSLAKIAWTHYRLFWIEHPRNVLSWEENGDTIIIKDAFSKDIKPYKYVFKTNMDNIKLNNFYFIERNGQESKIYVDVLLKDETANFKLDRNNSIELEANTDKVLYCAKKITAHDVCIDRGSLLTINENQSLSGKLEKSYTFTRNNNGMVFFNKIESTSDKKKIGTHKIRIKIEHTETCGYVEIKDPNKV